MAKQKGKKRKFKKEFTSKPDLNVDKNKKSKINMPTTTGPNMSNLKRKRDSASTERMETNGSKKPKLTSQGNRMEYTPKRPTKDDNDDDSGDEVKRTRDLNIQKNKKKKSGGFQSMGLSFGVLKGVLRRGYKIPTPIQRKTIPIILEHKDVVAMARTGSGKTAAFLVPMFERLKAHNSSGVRAVIMSPTRELALQTLKFAKELGKFTDLKAAVVLGGGKMDDQFAALHENPDIVIATPGRFLHILVEMELKLTSVEYVVFDEADRLYEMGFQDQLQEFLNRLPEARQTLLFSATLPKSLVEFAKAGLSDPVLVRLDVDSKLSENLKLTFIQCRESEKLALLLYMLKQVIDPDEQTIVFAATKHHVEFLHLLLMKAGLNATYIYSSLDQAARKINAAKFAVGKCKILIVTDLAARGIDVPLLDNVINFNFPGKPKLFVHRVGRVARAGRSGVAYSLLCNDEMAHVVDLHVFLGRPLKPVILGKHAEDEDGTLGEVPQSILDDKDAVVRQIISDSTELIGLEKSCANAYKKYLVSRPAPANESVRRIKQLAMDGIKLGIHPIFQLSTLEEQGARLSMINALKSYKPKSTIFEINSTSKKTSFEVMKAKREMHDGIINKNEERRKKREREEEEEARVKASSFSSSLVTSQNVLSGFSSGHKSSEVALADDDEISAVFNQVVTTKKKYMRESKKRKQEDVGEVKDKENFIQYLPSDYASEKGLSIGSNFEREAKEAVLDFTNDDVDSAPKKRRKWDRQKKKFVTDTSEETKRKTMIKTESGVWISASYKSNAYANWKSRNNTDFTGDNDGNDDDDNDNSSGKKKGKKGFKVIGFKGRNWHTKGQEGENDASRRSKKSKFKKERKSAEQILKVRKQKAKQEMRLKKKKMKKGGKGKGKGGGKGKK